MSKNLKDYLNFLIERKGSDLHLNAGENVYIRVDGELFEVSGTEVFSNDDMVSVAKEILTEEQYAQLADEKELDCAYSFDQNRRFRVNFFYQMEGLSAVLRLIPENILSIDELNLPSVVKDLADVQNGLVLVTGVTGSGKSTTIAAMLDRINEKQRKHIITIEDPIEFIQKSKKSLFTQRAIGINTHSFANGLRAALREDLDIIFIGELRDLETVEIALHAANTGHLVLSTLHTLDAKETISRIVGMFPTEEQDRIRMTLSFVLEGVITQRLVKSKDGGRVPAVEVMRKTRLVSELILDKRDNELLEAIEKGKEVYGSQSFDQSLIDLSNRDIIEKEEVLKYATSVSDTRLKLEGIKQSTGYDNLQVSEGRYRNAFDLKDDEEASE